MPFNKANLPSCVTCRRRKIKCDRQLEGCYNCLQTHAVCSYPPFSIHTPRGKRGPYLKTINRREQELEQQLKILEAKVDKLSSGVRSQTEVGIEPRNPDTGDVIEPLHDTHRQRKENMMVPFEKEKEREVTMRKYNSSGVVESRMRKGFGSWPITDAYSPSKQFWANFSGEIEDIQSLLEDSSSNDEHNSSSNFSLTLTDVSLQSFTLGLNSPTANLYCLHPPASQIPDYWNIYMANVDPMTKLLHAPSFGKKLMETKHCLYSLDKGFEALVFSIYFAVVTSMPAGEVEVRFGETKVKLLQRFEFAVKQALVRANFLGSHSFVTLQALTLYLICVRPEDTEVAWTLAGLAIRIAQSLGLYRDGTRFNLSPFEVEMRRRLWWNICNLDCRFAEDHGSKPSIMDFSFDTKLPLNINDDDLDPDALEAPEPRTGSTDMMLCLVGFEAAKTMISTSHLGLGLSSCSLSVPELPSKDKEKIITECHLRLESSYLAYCDNMRPFDWVTVVLSRLSISKMWLMIYHAFNDNTSDPISNDIKTKLLVRSIEVIEYSYLLGTEARTSGWAWIFQSYLQLHAVTYLLAELCHRTGSQLVDRAWKAVDDIFSGYDDEEGHTTNTAQWYPMNKLRARARKVREVDLKTRAQQSFERANLENCLDDGWLVNPSVATDRSILYPPLQWPALGMGARLFDSTTGLTGESELTTDLNSMTNNSQNLYNASKFLYLEDGADSINWESLAHLTNYI